MLHGRDAESARLDQLVSDASGSQGGALVVRGGPGVGKTALITALADRVSHTTVLWTAGIESESPLAFAGLHRLLRPILRLLDRVPAAHARALRLALGEHEARAEIGPSDLRFLVYAGTLSLLAESAEERPVLCVVDDAHWLDAMSTEALLFAARRLHADRIAMLFAIREEGAHIFAGSGSPQLVVAGLDDDAADALLAEHAPVPMHHAVRGELRRRTGGNPLGLVELSRALSDSELAGLLPLPAQLPLTEG